MKLKPIWQGLVLSQRKPLLIFILVLVIVVPLRSNAQDYIFNKVTLPKGTSSMGNVVQDKNGYMWMASGRGLIRYDGYEYKIYLNDPGNQNSLAQDHLEKIFLDKKGIIWIVTWTKGVDRFDPATNTFTHFRHTNDATSLSNDLVRDILEDDEGTLWIGTYGGLDRFDTKKESFIHYRYDPKDSGSLSCDRVRVLLKDKTGTLWVGTGSTWGESKELSKDEGGLNRFDRKTGKFTRYLYDPSNTQKLINNKVQALFEDSQGVFWVGTAGDGLHSLDRKTGQFQRYPFDATQPLKLSRPKLNSIPFTDYITFINEDAAGRIWIGTLGNGIAVYDRKTGKCVPYKLGNREVSEPPSAMNTSRDGISWISGWAGSLYNINSFHKSIPQFDLGIGVSTIVGELSSTLWLGTAEGLFQKDLVTGITKKYFHDPRNHNSISSNNVRSISRDKSGILWIATNVGLDRFEPNSNKFSHISNNRAGNFSGVFNLMTGGPDSLWTIQQEKVTLLNTKTNAVTQYRYDLQDSALLPEIRTVYIDRDGKIWISSFLKGLIMLDPITSKTRRFLGSIPEIYKIFQDSNGTMWIMSDEGLFFKEMAATDFSRFVDASGRTLTEYSSSIIEDDQKNLYFNGYNRIYRIKLDNLEMVFIEVRQQNALLNSSDLPGYFFGGAYKDKDGNLYFGTQTGYFFFSPGNLRVNPVPPQIMISRIIINGKPLNVGASGLMDSIVGLNNEILLAYNQNDIIIEFAGIHYGRPENNQHRYILENFDQEWHNSFKEKVATYSNLPPGDYIFRIKAANSDGVWSDKSLKIFISPPWWKTWWSYLLYFTILAVAVILIDRVQRGRIVARERERNREKELAQAKEIEKAYAALKKTQTQLIHAEKMASLGELTAGIAHEIQNPLNFVNNFSDVNRELLSDMKAELDRGDLETAKAIANDIINNEEKIRFHGVKADAIVKSMLQHSKSSRGEKEATQINELANEYLKLAYHGLQSKDKNFNINLELNFDPLLGAVAIIPQDIGRVLLNLYNNAFFAVAQKNHHAQGVFIPTVSVTTKGKGDIFEIRVKDNGSGIAENIQYKIFQPFFTTKPTGQGTGLGLSLSYDIVKAHGGEIKVESVEGEGACFIMTLPIK